MGVASAQKLPPPSATVFKCQGHGEVVYSDSPCLGAEKLEIEPADAKLPDKHRVNLTPALQRECQRLDDHLPRVEAQERRAREQAVPELQRRLYDLRKRYREIGC